MVEKPSLIKYDQIAVHDLHLSQHHKGIFLMKLHKFEVLIILDHEDA